jgi:hypothetical protein
MTSATYTIQVDGYQVGDRLLEGVLFDVTIIEDETGLTIKSVKPPTDPASKEYLSGIRVEKFLPGIQDQVQYAIDHLVDLAAKEGTTVAFYLDEWQTDEPKAGRMELLLQV